MSDTQTTAQNTEKIRAQVRKELAEAGLDAGAATIRIQRDPYRGWNIAVIAKDFARYAPATRREKIKLRGVDISWLDLLTPEEVAWAGSLPGDAEPDELPLWPEALARSAVEGSPSPDLASDRDDDLEPPIVATFYSLRGGVGRSTALAYTARILAARRRKVVCVDMDLEAPALPILLGCDDQVRDDRGVVDLLMALDQGQDPDFASHLVPASGSDDLFVIPAGRVSADYARKLRFVDPGAWYREDRNPLRLLIDGLKDKLPFQPDAILLDARTGITDLSGPLLFDLADLAVIVFFPHPQARAGTELLAQSLLRTTSRRSLGGRHLVPEVRFLISPVPSSNTPEIRRRYELRPLEWIDTWLHDFNERRRDHQLEAIDPRDIMHAVHYREELAVSDTTTGSRDTSAPFEPVAEWIQRFLRTPGDRQVGSLTSEQKREVLAELSFSAGAAEEQAGLLDDLVQTELLSDALSPQKPLVLGRKGTGKTAVFRFLSERPDVRAVVVHAPAVLKAQRYWQLSRDGFAAVDTILGGSAMGWSHFWRIYIAIALDSEPGRDRRQLRPPYLREVALADERGVIAALERTVAETHGGLELLEIGAWLQRLDSAAEEHTLLLFDGLDTGFGSTEDERDRRRRSVEGLFDAWMDAGSSFNHLKFKVMLREDIWRQLNFANKSHLYGKSVPLKWSTQTSFMKVVVKQAMRSEKFSRLLPASVRQENVDEWPEEAVRRAWNQLVGERMKGGQTAYTRNWVWSRLADANDDHSPRYLLQLFREAVIWERSEHQKSPYDKALIRPRGLSECLAQVSGQAVEALHEEFPELGPLRAELERAGRTPVDAAMLVEACGQELIALAKEVGLLSVYEESGEAVSRYKVPDLYRWGLGMTRRGQA